MVPFMASWGLDFFSRKLGRVYENGCEQGRGHTERYQFFCFLKGIIIIIIIIISIIIIIIILIIISLLRDHKCSSQAPDLGGY